MRIVRTGTTTKVWASKTDTYNWATRPGNWWPGSYLKGHRVFAELEYGDLVELTVDGRPATDHFSSNELDAFLTDCGVK